MPSSNSVYMMNKPSQNGYVSDPALNERVTNLSADVSSFRNELRDFRSTMATKDDIAAVFKQLTSLASKQDQISKPQYSLLVSIMGVGIAFLTMLGAFAYWPIASTQTDLKAAVIGLSDRAVYQRQYEADQSRLAAEQVRLQERVANTAISADRTAAITTGQVATAKKIEDDLNLIRFNFMRTQDFTAQHGDLKVLVAQEMGSLQRQLDILQKSIADIYPIRDTLSDMRGRINLLESLGKR